MDSKSVMESTSRAKYSSLDYDTFVKLLASMIAHTEKLQNKPPTLIPQESLIADIVINELKDCKNVSINKIEYVSGRANLIIKYVNFPNDQTPTAKSLGFIGSHFDCVPADPKEWKVDPFKLTIDKDDSDILYGRGSTDCLNHVALLTLLLKHLDQHDIKLNYVLGVVFIADEEHGNDASIGIPHLAEDGELDFLKHGPVYWMDSSDIYPTVGSGTGFVWEIIVTGKRGHSGLCYNSINPVILAMSATIGMMEVFRNNFPPHKKEAKYKYPCSSNMKPTQWKQTEGSINQIPSTAVVQGDVRATPFYDWKEIRRVLDDYIKSLNENPNQLPSYHDSFPTSLNDNEKSQVKFELKWLNDPYVGIACNMESVGFKLISDATNHVYKSMDVQSCCGSLPLIADLQASGLDMQIIGYGNGDAYHANNEYCKFSSMNIGYKILQYVLDAYCDH